MVFLEDLKDLVLYKKPFYLPINEDHKKKNSAVFLLTPNYESSRSSMKMPYMMNNRLFESYYMERDINYYITKEGLELERTDRYLHEEELLEESIFEASLSEKDRNNLQASTFGLPEQRRYPMPDKKHVELAIRFFNHIEKKYEKELAHNIIKKIEDFQMQEEIRVGEKNRFYPYWVEVWPDARNESSTMLESSFLNESNTSSLYFISQSENLQSLSPRVPNNYMTKNGYEDNKTARVCFSTSIDCCLRGLSQNCAGIEFYIYQPDGSYDVTIPSKKQVPDVEITNERWIATKVDLKCIGKIKVIKDSGKPGHKYTYGNGQCAELYDWDWNWIEHYTESTLNEGYILSKNDLYINFNKFESGESNICFVTGLSGSGKSTLAKSLASKHKAEWIELDIFEHCGGFNRDNIKEAGEVFYDYLSSHKNLWERLIKREVHGKELRDEIKKFNKYVISWCHKHKDNKYIIEGVQIYSLMDVNDIKGKPLVLVNASMLKSLVRKLKRNWDNRNDQDSDWKNELKHFPELIRWYIDGEKTYNEFKKELLEESTLLSESVVLESDTKLYFYHLAPKKIVGDKIMSIQYIYDNKLWNLFDEYTDKYRDRIINDWKYYNKNPEDLTRDEIMEGLKKFRNEDSLNCIYFFKFPPNPSMGKRMRSILKDKDIYAIDINDPKVKKYIDHFYLGNKDQNWYENISFGEYFKKYDDNIAANFSTIEHISIYFKHGYIPLSCVTKINSYIPLSESVVLESDRQSIIDSINTSLDSIGLKSHISKNGDWGSKKFLDGDGSLCLGSFKKEDYNRAYNQLVKDLKGKCKISKDNYFTLFAKINESVDMEDIVEESSNIKRIKTVSGILLNSDRNKLLVQEHNRTGSINLPSGKVDPGETEDEAFIREMKEELGIIVTKFRKLYTFSFGFNYKNDNSYYITDDTSYLILEYDGDISNIETSKHNAVGFMDLLKLKSHKNLSQTILRLLSSMNFDRNNYKIIFKKTGRLLFSGYEKDINDVKPYLNTQTIKDYFYKVMVQYKEYDRFIIISGMDDGFDYIDNKNITILSRDIYEKNYNGSYADYIKTCIYVHAFRCLNPNVDAKIVYPLALYSAGLYDNKNKNMIELFKSIYENFGKDEIYKIVKNNDFVSIMSHAAKFKISKYIGEEVNLADPTKLAAHIKRASRKASKYEMNRIERETEKVLNPNQNTPDTYKPATKEDIVESFGENGYFDTGSHLFVLEEKTNTNALLKNTMYKDRIKTSKELLEIYTKVKLDNPFIKYTFQDIARYTEKNLFIDLSYYNEIYFKNAMYESIRGYNLYLDLIGRLINDKAYKDRYKKKTVFIPVLDWNNNSNTKMWLYKEDINPISIIYQLMKTDPHKLSVIFKDMDIVFLGAKNYFKINFSKFEKDKEITNKLNIFLNMIKKIITLGFDSPAEPDPIDEPENSPKGITMDIVDKIEKSQGIQINNINTKTDKTTKDASDIKTLEKKNDKDIKNTETKNVNKEDKIKSTKIDTSKSAVVNTIDKDKMKEDLVKSIAKAAIDASDTNNTIDKLEDEDKFKQLLIDLSREESDKVKMNASRNARSLKLQDELSDKIIKGKSVYSLLQSNHDNMKLPSTKLNISTPNNEWKELTFMNFDKKYDVDSDIVKTLNSMKDWSYPVFIRNINVTDNSTSEDYLELYTVECEDSFGTRFTLKFDVPKFKENRYMLLRGNKKTLLIQSFLLPIIKTDLDTCQIITNYNKIFVSRFGSSSGKSNVATDRLIKTFRKYQSPNLKITNGDNTRISAKYELPIDYIDLSSRYDKIIANNYTIYFNQDELRKEYQVDDNLGLPYAVYTDIKGKKNILYYNGKDAKNTFGKDVTFSYRLYLDLLGELGSEFNDVFNKTTNSTKYMYSRASIMSVDIPLVVLCAYSEGLVSTMDKAGIKYEYTETLDRHLKNDLDRDYIKFEDGFIVYDVDYISSLLMNGLKECDTANYSIKDINSKSMYLSFLDNFGGRIKSDGLDTFYDCMIDPISKEILERCDLPTDYISVLLYANILLADNKYIAHTKMDGRRFRRGELIAGYVYKAVSGSYGDYLRLKKHSRSKATMTIKQSTIIDMVLTDTISSDTSVNNAINDIEGANTVTNKGPSGMNTERAYGLDKRTYDESMLNILGMSTGFAGNVGINRQATVDANIEGSRGFVKSIDGDVDKLNSAKSLTITEALTPYGVTSDDPFRTAMTFIQTSKHMVRTEESSPLLVTNGADEAMPYLVSDIFAFKAKQDGKIVEVATKMNEFYMVVEYKDGSYEYIDLDKKIEKNSDGGYNVIIQLKSDLKLGDTVKEGDVIAYDPLSFVDASYGDSNNLDYAVGTLAKVAIVSTDEGFEDSAAIDNSLTQKLATDIVIPIEKYFPKTTNIELLKHVGDTVRQEESLMVFQTPSDDEDVNILLKNLSADAGEISELGRNPIKAKVSGDIVDIKIYRTCELDEMSDSLKKIVIDYEKGIKNKRKVYNKYKIESNTELPADYKLSQTGKLKRVEDGVLIVFYIRRRDVVSIGDKVVFYSANKGVIKYIFPDGQEPYTDYRPNEKINAFVSVGSISGRMVCSTPKIGAFTKLMIELDRSVKDIAGIPYDDNI